MRIKTMKINHLLPVALLALLTAAAAHGSASFIMHQGLLIDDTGVAAGDGAYAMEFTIWDAPTDGAMLWMEGHGDVTVSGGAFAVFLGGLASFSTLFVDHDALWLQAAADLGAGMELFGPRVPLAAAPYALKAEHADHASHATTADSAATAGSATTADSATTAVSSNTADATTTADNAAALGGEAPSAFAPAAHSHDASAITSGVLSTDRFSAYADLTAEGKIGAGGDQVAAGNHRHDLPFFIGSLGGARTGIKEIATIENSGITNNGATLTVPVAGRYFVHAQQLINTGGSAFYFDLLHNGGEAVYGYFPSGTMQDMVVSRILNMNAGDTIQFRIRGATVTNVWGHPHSTVTVYLIG